MVSIVLISARVLFRSDPSNPCARRSDPLKQRVGSVFSVRRELIAVVFCLPIRPIRPISGFRGGGRFFSTPPRRAHARLGERRVGSGPQKRRYCPREPVTRSDPRSDPWRRVGSAARNHRRRRRGSGSVGALRSARGERSSNVVADRVTRRRRSGRRRPLLPLADVADEHHRPALEAAHMILQYRTYVARRTFLNT